MNMKYKNVFFAPGIDNAPGGISYDSEDLVPSPDTNENSAREARPRTKRELILAALAAGDSSIENIQLKTRREYYLAKIGGDGRAEDIKPKNREESFLDEFVKGSKDLGSEDAGADTGAGEQRI